MAVLLLAGIFGLSREGARLVSQQKEEGLTVVLDAGHGGTDPGKIGVNGEKEKELNLEITMLLKEKLEKQGIQVVLTRDSDGGLYDEQSNNKKVQDLQRRCELIHKTSPRCAVSIHQNSYTTPEVKGAQVFYYTNSAEGKKLAEGLQTALVEGVDPENHREAKGNTSYYLLKKTDVPLAIVECGFLSNVEESEKLINEEYQNKLAEAIKLGIDDYFTVMKPSDQAK